MTRDSRRISIIVTLAALASLALVGFSNGEEASADSDTVLVAQSEGSAVAAATLNPTEGNTVSGAVTFTQTEEGVHIQGDLTGLTPGEHGFHIHMWGDCSAPDGTSAGGHFNPHTSDHGAPDGEMRHVGDLGNITADEAGNASYDRVDAHLAFDGDASILGRGLIVHAGTDDLASQPTGAAGPRVACGIIGVANPAPPAE